MAFPLAAAGADEVGLPHGMVLGAMNVCWGFGFFVGPAAGAAIAQASSDRVTYLLAALLAACRAAGAAEFGTRRHKSAKKRLDEIAARCYDRCWHSTCASANDGYPDGGSMDLKPLGDRVIVEVLDEEETTISGIVLPDTAKEKPQRGNVLEVGPGRYEDGKLVPLDVTKGDEVIFSKYGGTEVKVGGEEFLILRESDILAKVATTKAKAKAKA